METPSRSFKIYDRFESFTDAPRGSRQMRVDLRLACCFAGIKGETVERKPLSLRSKISDIAVMHNSIVSFFRIFSSSPEYHKIKGICVP